MNALEEDKINFTSNFLAWSKDKFRTLSYFWYAYIPTIVIWTLALISLGADLESLTKSPHTVEIIALSSLVLIFGIYNIIQSTVLERFRVRNLREISSFRTMHEIIEQLREYRERTVTRKEGDTQKTTLPKIEIVDKLNHICDTLNKGYMFPRHGDTCVTLKIRNGNQIESIRGAYGKGRDNKPEKLKECYIFKVLNEQKIPFLYIGDLTDPTKSELKRLGNNYSKLKYRAERHGYKSLLALPIKTGNQNPTGNPVIKESLGFIGFDSNSPNGFGNISKQEIDYLACFVDSLSEIVADFKISN